MNLLFYFNTTYVSDDDMNEEKWIEMEYIQVGIFLHLTFNGIYLRVWDKL